MDKNSYIVQEDIKCCYNCLNSNVISSAEYGDELFCYEGDKEENVSSVGLCNKYRGVKNAKLC